MKQTNRMSRKCKKHLPKEEKLQILKKLGPNPSKLRVQTMSAQYNVRSQTILNWIYKGLDGSALSYEYMYDKRRYKPPQGNTNNKQQQKKNKLSHEEMQEDSQKEDQQEILFSEQFPLNNQYNQITKLKQRNSREMIKEESEYDIEIIL